MNSRSFGRCIYHAVVRYELKIHSAKPINYRVSLFDLQLGGSWRYKGVVEINTKVSSPTKEIVLNSKEIDVQEAKILGKDGETPKQAQHNKKGECN